jgi:two-component sensor histidine kinase
MMRGPYASLDASRSLMLTMALHELATNAGKYGALSNDFGRVSVDWTVVEARAERNIQLSWREEGGPPVRPPAHKGFGSRLIENSFEPHGAGTARSLATQGRPFLVFAPHLLRARHRPAIVQS